MIYRAVASYPLSPFFVLFCNVVCTSSQEDFHLIQQITECLSQLADADMPITALHKLCTMFISLCAPLTEEYSGQHPSLPTSVAHFSAGNTLEDYTASTGNLSDVLQTSKIHTPVTFLDGSEDKLNGMSIPGTTAIVPGSSHSGTRPSTPPPLWGEDLMWQLFDIQPCMDWFNSELVK
jgi:hypothetical protein